MRNHALLGSGTFVELFVRDGDSWRAEIFGEDSGPLVVVHTDGVTKSSSTTARQDQWDALAGVQAIYRMVGAASYLGRSTIRGHECHKYHYESELDDAEAEIWIEARTGIVRRAFVDGGGVEILTDYYDLSVPDEIRGKLFDLESLHPLLVQASSNGD